MNEKRYLNTQQIMTEKLIKGCQQVANDPNETPKNRRFALRKLIEISQQCPYDDLASMAHRVVVAWKQPVKQP